MTHSFQKIKKRWLQDPSFRREQEIQNPEYRLSLMLIAARLEADLTQREVAERMGMSVRTVSRLESGNIPFIRQLDAMAKALNRRLEFSLQPLHSWNEDPCQ